LDDVGRIWPAGRKFCKTGLKQVFTSLHRFKPLEWQKQVAATVPTINWFLQAKAQPRHMFMFCCQIVLTVGCGGSVQWRWLVSTDADDDKYVV